MKKLVAILLAALLVCTAVSALAYSKDEPITITFWHTRGSGANNKALVNLVDKFNASVGAEKGIIVQEVYQGDYTAVKTKVQLATQTNEQPVLALGGCAHYEQWLEDGLLANMYPLAQETGFDIGNLLDCFIGTPGMDVDNGEMYTMPYIRSVPVLYYNKTLADAKGLTLPLIPTIDEWLDFSRALYEVDEATGEVNVWGTTVLGNYSYIGTAFPRQLGYPLIADDCSGSPALESGALLKNLSDWRSWVDEGFYRPQDPTGTAPSLELFYQGKMGCLVTSCGSMGNIVRQMAEAGYELGVVCYPTYDINNNSTEIGGGQLCLIATGNTDEQIRAGWEFIQFFMTDEMVYEEAITSGYVPVTKSIRDYEPMKKFWEENPYYIAAYECLEWGVCQEFPTWPGLTDLNNSINALYHTLLEEGSITAEEAVEQFRAEIDGLF